jgi:hypothetical protein
MRTSLRRAGVLGERGLSFCLPRAAHASACIDFPVILQQGSEKRCCFWRIVKHPRRLLDMPSPVAEGPDSEGLEGVRSGQLER